MRELRLWVHTYRTSECEQFAAAEVMAPHGLVCSPHCPEQCVSLEFIYSYIDRPPPRKGAELQTSANLSKRHAHELRISVRKNYSKTKIMDEDSCVR